MVNAGQQRFRRLPGTSRKYVDTLTGETITRDQRDKRAKAAQLYQPMNPVRRANFKRSMGKYRSAREARQRELASRGVEVTTRQVMNDPELKRLNVNARRARKRVADMIKRGADVTSFADLTPKQIKALEGSQEAKKQFLVYIGYRNGIPDWVPVGASDDYRRGRLRRDRPLKKWRALIPKA